MAVPLDRAGYRTLNSTEQRLLFTCHSTCAHKMALLQKPCRLYV